MYYYIPIGCKLLKHVHAYDVHLRLARHPPLTAFSVRPFNHTAVVTENRFYRHVIIFLSVSPLLLSLSGARVHLRACVRMCVYILHDLTQPPAANKYPSHLTLNEQKHAHMP